MIINWLSWFPVDAWVARLPLDTLGVTAVCTGCTVKLIHSSYQQKQERQLPISIYEFEKIIYWDIKK